jgi:hypothetical protein
LLACIVVSIFLLSRRYADTAALDKAREGVYNIIEEDGNAFVIRRKSRLVTAMKALQVRFLSANPFAAISSNPALDTGI